MYNIIKSSVSHNINNTYIYTSMYVHKILLDLFLFSDTIIMCVLILFAVEEDKNEYR